MLGSNYPTVRKQRAPKGALRPARYVPATQTSYRSESTERQTAH